MRMYVKARCTEVVIKTDCQRVHLEFERSESGDVDAPANPCIGSLSITLTDPRHFHKYVPGLSYDVVVSHPLLDHPETDDT